jgi:bifunctional non-homologous end joining protein LigD
VRERSAIPAYDCQLALLVDEPPEGDEWVHELKFDGYRIGCVIDGPRVTLVSRNGNDWTAQFPEVVGAVRRLKARQALLDGEVAVVLPDGRTSFQALQGSFGDAIRRRLVYFVFDLLHLDGRDLRPLPLERRKEELRRLLAGAPPTIRFSAHVTGGGAAYLREACRLGLEGIVSKRRDAPYRAGRGGGWLKIKCTQRQELIIGGYTDPEGSRVGIGALLVGHRAGGKLVFAGKVGTGFTNAVARDLRRRLEAIARPDSPFDPTPPGPLGRRAHWVEPRLVAEVAFSEWTDDGKVRHPSFQGLRADKTAAQVVRERPARRALAAYLEAVADHLLPHVAGRPLTLVRCREGLEGPCEFMRHVRRDTPRALRRVRIPEKTKLGEYLVADDLAGLLALVELDVVEIHTWNARVPDVERPDRLVVDLDPGPAVPWPEVIRGARAVRRALAALGLASWVKNTGGAGLHVVVPIAPARGWDECLAFARDLCEALAARDDAVTTAIPKAGRERKILLDYLRNNRTNTSIAAFSPRARPGLPVSTPLAWDELSARVPPDHYTTETVLRRLARLRADPWRNYFRCRQELTDEMLRAVSKT